MSYTNLHFTDCLPIWAVVEEHNTQMCATLLAHAPRVRTIDGSIKRYPCELKNCIFRLKCSTHNKALEMTSYTIENQLIDLLRKNGGALETAFSIFEDLG